eukprot:COSAG02_NODE_2041_length_10027_cov_21.142023_9_plen_53_part_00
MLAKRTTVVLVSKYIRQLPSGPRVVLHRTRLHEHSRVLQAHIFSASFSAVAF